MRRSVDHQTSTARFEPGQAQFGTKASFFFDPEAGKFKEDPSKLILFCDREQVGAFNFDLGSYFGKKPKKETVHLRPAGYEPKNADDLFFEGDQTKFAEASITFSVKCITREEKL